MTHATESLTMRQGPFDLGRLVATGRKAWLGAPVGLPTGRLGSVTGPAEWSRTWVRGGRRDPTRRPPCEQACMLLLLPRQTPPRTVNHHTAQPARPPPHPSPTPTTSRPGPRSETIPPIVERSRTIHSRRKDAQSRLHGASVWYEATHRHVGVFVPDTRAHRMTCPGQHAVLLSRAHPR